MQKGLMLFSVVGMLALSACGVTTRGDWRSHGGIHDVPANGWGLVAEAPTKKAARDSDGDGIPDRKDNCPKEAGTAENKGCAAKQDVEIVDGRLAIADAVYFESGKDAIEARSFALLDQIAAVLQNHDEILKLSVEGHTDDTGDAAFNRDLSNRRAAAVVAYLTGKGVASTRLGSTGFGPDQPVVPNDSDENRAKNRRVEFRIVEQRADDVDG
jgi:OmpA-OmpF porin, OOP family